MRSFTDSFELQCARAAYALSCLALRVAEIRLSLSLKAGFDPAQPRDELGRWTETGADSDEGIVQRVSQDGDASRYRVLLAEEEARGGHAIKRHVAISDEALLARLAADNIAASCIRLLVKESGRSIHWKLRTT